MDTNCHDRLRRAFRAAIFRTERLRLAGRDAEAAEQLSLERAATQAQLATAGEPDPAATLRRWHDEDLAAFDFAHLLGELVAERIGGTPRESAPAATVGSYPSVPDAPASAVPQQAFPPPPTGIPGLADLLDDMLSQDRRRGAPHR